MVCGSEWNSDATICRKAYTYNGVIRSINKILYDFMIDSWFKFESTYKCDVNFFFIETNFELLVIFLMPLAF